MKFLCAKCHRLYCMIQHESHKRKAGTCEMCGRRTPMGFVCYGYDMRERALDGVVSAVRKE